MRYFFGLVVWLVSSLLLLSLVSRIGSGGLDIVEVLAVLVLTAAGSVVVALRMPAPARTSAQPSQPGQL